MMLQNAWTFKILSWKVLIITVYALIIFYMLLSNILV